MPRSSENRDETDFSMASLARGEVTQVQIGNYCKGDLFQHFTIMAAGKLVIFMMQLNDQKKLFMISSIDTSIVVKHNNLHNESVLRWNICPENKIIGFTQ